MSSQFTCCLLALALAGLTESKLSVIMGLSGSTTEAEIII